MTVLDLSNESSCLIGTDCNTGKSKYDHQRPWYSRPDTFAMTGFYAKEDDLVFHIRILQHHQRSTGVRSGVVYIG
jgi:hypothetical protein